MPAAELLRMNRVWRELHSQQQSNIRKAASNAFRYRSQLALDLSFEIWFHGGMIALF